MKTLAAAVREAGQLTIEVIQLVMQNKWANLVEIR